MGKQKFHAAPPKRPPKRTKAPLLSYGHALLILLVAIAAFYYISQNKNGASSHAAQRPQNPRGGAQPATAQSQQRRKSDFELLQEGRSVAGSQRPRCVDGMGCGAVTAEDCGSESIRSRCCLSCFKATCVDKDPSCIRKAQRGACYLEREYMNATCCYACSPDPEDPCSPDPSKRPDVAEGDLTRVFERAVAEYPQYSPKVLSRDPWVVSFENIMTPEEADGVYEAVGGKNEEYLKPSTTAQVRNGVLTDVPDTIRTSWNAWCQHAFCYNHPMHERVISRIMDIVGLPHNHAEHMQLLRYSPGEYYRMHHDWIPQQEQALCGPRVYTFFLYLSDVEEGGGTKFPYIKDKDGQPLIVQPRKGSAVWWPHGMEHNLWEQDDRTHHEAMPVVKGVKKAANYWIHGSDFKTSMANGCDGRQKLGARIWRSSDKIDQRRR